MNSTNSPGVAIIELLVSNCCRSPTNSQMLASGPVHCFSPFPCNGHSSPFSPFSYVYIDPSSLPFNFQTSHLDLHYQAFPNDRVFTKGLVCTVYCLSLVAVILATIDAFNTFGYGFGDPSALNTAEFAYLLGPVFGGMGNESQYTGKIKTSTDFLPVACIVQSFYAFRLYQFSHSRVIPCILVFAAVVMCATGMMYGVWEHQLFETHLAKAGANLSTGLAVTAVLTLVGTALIDITIAWCMTYYLIKSDTGFRRTHALVTKLIRLSIETGVITALVVISILALFFAHPDKAYYVVPGNSISTVYANTLFAVLNSRFQILNGRADVQTSDNFISIPSNIRSPVVSITREEFSDGSIPVHRVQATEMKKMNDSATAV
ncbi:hypothetical protein B0H16DRAFT_1878446 [Mycena metata]|uniref:DUF6534 domain-containing protein n=1 Tax=Mycena metata TaxID=1033252 RepID=A0AAD7K9I9_9AGAR|nr:hypothetical protein B0H16DRAFT_1878446 [Mycena metata]